MASLIYNNAKELTLKAGIDFSSDTIKVMLVKSTYTPSADNDDFIDDANTYEVTGTGYSAGGAALGSKTVTQDNTNDRGVFDAADTSWTSASIAGIRGAVIYKDTGTPSTSPVIAYVDFAADYNVVNGTFQITWSANGILYIG